MQRYIKLDSFTAVGPGETANVVLQTGSRYDEIHLKSNQIDEIERVTLTLNAVELFSLTLDELKMLDAYNRVEYESTGHISLPLGLNEAVMLDAQVATGLVTGPGDNAVLEVKFSDAAISPTLKGFANVSAHNGVRARVRRFIRYTIPVTGAGQIDFTSLVKGPDVMRMFFKSALIEKLEIKQNDRTVFELDEADNAYLLDRAFKTAPVGYFVFDSIKRDYPVADSMSTQWQNLNFRLTVAEGGAQNISVLVEQVDQTERADWRRAS